MLKRTLLAVTVLASALGRTAVAGEYIVEISGAEGTVGGTCLLITANNNISHVAAGPVPLRLEFSGDIISCAMQRKSGAAHLRIVIRNLDGRVVGESAEALPFGIVIAAGR